MPGKFDVGDVVTRLEHCSRRIYRASVDALYLCETWSTFNGAADQRRAISQSPAGIAAAVYEDAALRNLILILVRLLDSLGKRRVLESDKISFPVVQCLLSLPGVTDVFIERARTSISASILEGPEQNTRAVRDRIASFSGRLHCLKVEHPNRAQRLRDFRDGNIAHELCLDEPKAKPLYTHIPEMVSEILVLTEDVHLIVDGSPSTYWPRGEASASAKQLWGAVAAAFSLRD